MRADGHSNIFMPTHPDQNYVALGHVVRRQGVNFTPNPPAPGQYYLIHRKYLVDLGLTAVLFLNEDGIPCYRTVDGTNLFRSDNPQKYAIRDDAQLQACCTGSGSSCDIYTKGSDACQKAMMSYCSGSDIRPGGKCEDWCTRDPIGCDKIKQKFCAEHPDDPFCDCINAFSRADHTAFIKGKETVYSYSIPACYYQKCKLGPYQVFTTTEMTAAQNGERCSQDLKYIDQQIKVTGTGNILSTNQTSNENSGENSGTTVVGNGEDGSSSNGNSTTSQSTILGISKPSFIVIVFVILMVVVAMILYNSGMGDSNYDPRLDVNNGSTVIDGNGNVVYSYPLQQPYQPTPQYTYPLTTATQ
jgi:hypothetical protein